MNMNARTMDFSAEPHTDPMVSLLSIVHPGTIPFPGK